MVSFYYGFMYLFVLSIIALSQALPRNETEHIERPPKTLRQRLPAGVYPVLTVNEIKKQKDIDPKLSNIRHINKYNSKRNHVINTEHNDDGKSNESLIVNLKTHHPDVAVSMSQNNTIVTKVKVSEDGIKYTTQNNTRATKAKISEGNIKHTMVTETLNKVKTGDEDLGCFYDTLYNEEDCSGETKERRVNTSTRKLTNVFKFINNVSTKRFTKIDKGSGTKNILTNILKAGSQISNNNEKQTKQNNAATKAGNDEPKIKYLQTDENLRNEQLLNITKNQIVDFAVNLFQDDPLFDSKGLSLSVTKDLLRYLLNTLLSNYLLDKPSDTSSIMSLLHPGKHAEAKAKITPTSLPNLKTNGTVSTIGIKINNHSLNGTSNITVPRNALTLINTGNIIKLNTTIAVDGHKVVINNDNMTTGVQFVNANMSNEEYIENIADIIRSRTFGAQDLGTFNKKAKKKLVKAIVHNIAQGMVVIINSGTISGLNLNIINEKHCMPPSNSKEFETTSAHPEIQTTTINSDEETIESESLESTEEPDHPGSTVKLNGVKDE